MKYMVAMKFDGREEQYVSCGSFINGVNYLVGDKNLAAKFTDIVHATDFALEIIDREEECFDARLERYVIEHC